MDNCSSGAPPIDEALGILMAEFKPTIIVFDRATLSKTPIMNRGDGAYVSEDGLVYDLTSDGRVYLDGRLLIGYNWRLMDELN